MKEEIVTLTEENLPAHRTVCGLSGRDLEGNSQKNEWLKARFSGGMRDKIYQINGRRAGFSEYIPGEFAWRGVDAKDYYGVAVVAGKTHWLPTPKIFLKNGFKVVDHPPPSFDLLVKRNSTTAPVPRFKQNRRKANKYPKGLTLVKGAQCPHVYVMDEGRQPIGRELHVPVNIVQVNGTKEAQNMPCAYDVMGLFHNGALLTYHPTIRKQIVELLESKV